MISYGSKLVSEQSIDQLQFKPSTPQKEDTLNRGSLFNHGPQLPLSPFLGKSNTKKSIINNDSIKLDYGDFSTRRSYTPVKSTIATEILCELCERVFPPN